jgi:AraC-like DNA-binding protein
MRVLPDPEPLRRSERALLERIKDSMRQLCTSPTLTAADVAAAVGVSLRTFHRSFQRAEETFGNTLTQMRCVYGIRMLESPLFRRVSVGEIARRAGFCDASHFCRVVRSRTGLTPRQLRRGDVAPHLDDDAPEERS